MSDPIADLLTRIRNAYLAGKKSFSVPYSEVKERLILILVKEGFLAKAEVKGKKPSEKVIKVILKYRDGQPVLNKIIRISKPGQRIYARADKIPSVKLGYGVTVVSTSQGLMIGKEARKKNLGGEVICQIW
ncbi:30S ribosomal protein S8 [Patescibacteria group bacterium]